jgi:hypothetical protein
MGFAADQQHSLVQRGQVQALHAYCFEIDLIAKPIANPSEDRGASKVLKLARQGLPG